MSSIIQNIYIDQGATYSQGFIINNANNEPYVVAGASAQGMIRKNYASSNSVSFAILLTDGLVTIGLDANTTLSIAAGRYVYDVKMTDIVGNVTRVAEGIATIMPAVTHTP
jgi:hypothetical protein